MAGLDATISARQGAGMCQISPNEIMIVGGFNGKFLSDYYIIDTDDQNGNAKTCKKYENANMQQSQTLFPFQVPTIGDS